MSQPETAWEKNPTLSPLYEEHPNTSCDEHGILRCKPYWNTAVKKTICGILYCKKCEDNKLYNVNKQGEKICSGCNTKVGEV